MLLVFALLIAIAGLTYIYLRHHYDYWQRKGIPHERPLLIYGNLKGIGETVQLRDIYDRVYKRFKGSAPFTGLFMMFAKQALIMDLDLIKSILIKDFQNFHDRAFFYNLRDDPLTGHLINIEGEQWRAMRNKLTPVFTSGKMKFMFPTVVEVSKRLTEACDKLVNENAATADIGEIEVKELCARYTTDTIGCCAFGLECNSLKDPNAEFRIRGRSILESPRHWEIIQMFMFVHPDWARALRMKFFTDEVNDFFMNAVKTTVEYRLKNEIHRNDFMDLMIGMKATDEEMARKGQGIDLSHGLTMEQIAAQAFAFFLAGFDTSSTTMAFCLYELALNPEVQEKLREDIKNTIQKYGDHDGQLLNYEAMNEMVYLEQVLNETMRKYPVITSLMRKTVNDYKIPNTNYVIESGTIVVIPTESIQNDAEYFPAPHKFDPMRFTPEQIQKRHSSVFLPFGDGPRNCIGLRFGKMQAKIGLITLLQNYRISRSSRTEVPIEFCKKNFILTAKNGIHLHFEKL